MNKNNTFIIFSFIFLFFSDILVANQRVTLQLSWLHQFQFAGFYMAKEKGFYRDANLDVYIKEFTYDLNRATYLKEKKADFAIGRSSLLIDQAQGEDVVALGAIYQKSPLMLLVTKDSGIKELGDLKDKKIMVTDDAKDSVAITAMLHANGLNLNDVQIQNHSFNVNDLIENKTDAMASYISNEPVALGNKNIEYKIFHPKDYGFDFYGDILYTSSRYINSNPKIVKDFFDASLKGWEYALENINEAVEVIYDKYNTQNKTKSDLLKEANELRKLVYENGDKKFGSLDKLKLQKIVDVYKVLGLINRDIDLDKFIYEHNPYKTYAFELSKLEIIYFVIISLCIIFLLVILFILYSTKSKLLVTNSQLLNEVKSSEQALDKSYETLHKLTENIPGAIYKYRLYLDGKTTFSYVSKGIEDMYEVLTKDILEDENLLFNNVHPDDLNMLEVSIKESAQTMKEWNIEYRVNLPKKGLRWFHGKAKPEKLEDGSILWYGVISDVTQMYEIQNAYKQERDLNELYLNTVDVLIVALDTKGRVTMLNRKGEELLGYKEEELLGKVWFEIGVLPEDIVLDVKEFFTGIINVNQSLKEELQHALITKDKKELIFSFRTSFLYDDEKNCIGILSSGMDITQKVVVENELIKQKDILYHQAHHDSLTGLPNRTLFNDRLEKAIQTAKRNKTKIALLFIDLDHFKEINDSLGHNYGDEILKSVSKKLDATIRDEDTLARLGGDEFTIILEELSHTQDASKIANKILDSLSQAFIVANHTLYVSCSIGISIYPDDGLSALNLLKFADSAMYKAKDEGRNNYQYYNSSMTELAFERVVMETSLRMALKNEEFVVFYQPQINGATDKLIGMEALVRWQHPTMGLVSPIKFISLAESTGLIVELDRYVMKTAMTQVANWYKSGLNPGILAINLTIQQLKQDDFVYVLQNLIKETGCKAEWLELEVTENQIMTNPDEAIKILEQISDMGIELAIDDFGTGYSSLAYLKRLPIDKLKIDQAFIRNLPDDEEDSAIAKAIIALGQSLYLKVIAEGVETKAQKDFLIENECENIQGYFYSKALPTKEIEVLLKK
nr:EAL domain-containing protein [uncultured Sulfurimonas sp.]